KSELSWEVGTLTPGQSRTIEYQVIAKKAGLLRNKAVVSAAGGARDQVESCVCVGEARLQLTKRGPEQRSLHLPATYQITVCNAGTVPATNVVITDPLPERAMYVSASQGGKIVGTQVQWTIGTLAPGARRTVLLTYRAMAAGEIVNQATATADRGLTA